MGLVRLLKSGNFTHFKVLIVKYNEVPIYELYSVCVKLLIHIVFQWPLVFWFW